MTSPQDEVGFVSVKAAAQIVELDQTTIRAAINKQHLPAYRVGRAIRIERADLIAWLRAMPRVGSDDDI